IEREIREEWAELAIECPSMDPSLLLHLVCILSSSVLGCVPTRPTSTPSPLGRYPPVFHHARTYLPLDDLPLFNGSLLPQRETPSGGFEVSSNIVPSPDTLTQSLISALSSPLNRDPSLPPSTLRTLVQWLASLAPPHHSYTANDTVTNTTTLTQSANTTELLNGIMNDTALIPTTSNVIPGMPTTTVTTTTTTMAPTTTTTVAPTDCCPALTVTMSPIEFPDGNMVFTYNNDACRSTVSVSCSQTDPAFELYAAIVANGDNFLDYLPNSVTFPGTCNGGTWFMGSPPLAIVTLECRLTNPPTNP
ncbi:hypothetical protein PMAYCL1PPCAC_18525, partial [Pristionchus mayeri]